MSKKIIPVTFSNMDLFNQCPLKWYYTVLKKMRSKGNVFALFGKAMHNLLELVYKLEIFEPQPYLDRWKRIFDTEYQSKSYPEFTQNILKWQLYRGYPMIKKFFETAAKYDVLKSALGTEKKISGKFGNYLVVGRYDLEHILKKKNTLVDYKSGKTKSESHKHQLTLYTEIENTKRKTNKIEQCALWYLPTGEVEIFKPTRKATALFLRDTLAEQANCLKTKTFERRKNRFCKYCIVKEKGLCK